MKRLIEGVYARYMYVTIWFYFFVCVLDIVHTNRDKDTSIGGLTSCPSVTGHFKIR